MSDKKTKSETGATLLAFLDMTQRLDSEKAYEKKLKELQQRMMMIQSSYFHQKRRAVIVFEGWDAAGKGGAIRRIAEKLDPRGLKVHAISAPSAEEQGKHYLYRFWTRLPKQGTLAIFDRSWYGRVLVERVEGVAKTEEWQRAYDEINEFERLLTDDGARIVKVFLHVTPDEQLKRFEERLNNPYKRWKLTTDDIRNRSNWQEYEVAIEEMLSRTSTGSCPWHLVAGNYKWYARTQCLEVITNALSEGVDVSMPPIDKEMVKAAKKELGLAMKDD